MMFVPIGRAALCMHTKSASSDTERHWIPEQFIADHLLVTRFALKRHWQRAWSSLSAVSC